MQGFFYLDMGGDCAVVYMVTYDLNAPGQKYEQVLAVLDSIAEGEACSFWQSSYLLKSALAPAQIMDKLKPHLDENDKVLVIQVTKNHQGWLDDTEWRKFNKLF